ncbi:MAG TPA: hypothetical protein PLU71_01625 [Candidatus Dependentiae bacterium]|nr:hypothetical protein [Candidatus Dependentiae bacterium]HRQ62531.1 hypothetical protein [Candidatus Dependentiae bacterium]
MKQFRKQLSFALLLSSSLAFGAIEQSVTPKFTIRSQGTNAVRRMVESVGNMFLYGMDSFNGTYALTLEYSQSFNNDDIAKCLFGDALCGCKVNVQGSHLVGRDENALLADYFYLPTDYDGSFSIDPKIQNFSADFFLYFGLDQWATGLYAWVQFPITWTKWDLQFCETIVSTGTNNHCEGYFTPNELPRSELLQSFKSYISGNAPGNGTITQEADFGGEADVEFVTKFCKLGCAKICGCGEDTKTTVPEVRFALGWNFLLEEDYHLGLNIQASAPTGNNVAPTYLFAAQNGNDHHWELGVGLNAHFLLWRSEDEEKHFGFYLDANVTHMFKNSQCRCFDLCGKPLSRYMLAERLGRPVENNLTGIPDLASTATTAATSQFAQEFCPVANITNLKVDVSVGANADIVAMFNYTSGGLSWDFGYNFWGRSCEKIKLDCNCTTFQENTWALKGDAHVYGYMLGDSDPLEANDPIALSATQSEATINGGTNFGTAGVAGGSVAALAGKGNPNIDHAQIALAGATEDTLEFLTPQRGDIVDVENINTSIQPVFITQSDINFARTKGISNKLFSNLSYNWINNETWMPYVGVGFEVEWASHGDNCKDECCSPCTSNSSCCDTSCCDDSTNGNCLKCGLSQWGVWIKGGVSYR